MWGRGEGIYTPCAIFGSVDVRGKASEELGIGAEYWFMKDHTLCGREILALGFNAYFQFCQLMKGG